MRKKYLPIISVPIIILFVFTHTLTVSSQESPGGRIPAPSPVSSQPAQYRDKLLSNNKKLLAYTTKAADSWVNQDILIQDIEKNTSVTIKLKLDMPFQIASWSPDDSYLYIFEESHYYGGLKGKIVDVKSKKVLHSFPTLNQDITWVNNNEFLYFDPENQCNNSTNCKNLSIRLKQHNLKLNKVNLLLERSSQNERLPLVKYPTRIGNKFEFGIADNYLDYTSNITGAIEVDINTGNTRTMNKENLLVLTMQKSLPTGYRNIEILTVEETPEKQRTYKVKARKNINSEEIVHFKYNQDKPTALELI